MCRRKRRLLLICVRAYAFCYIFYISLCSSLIGMHVHMHSLFSSSHALTIENKLTFQLFFSFSPFFLKPAENTRGQTLWGQAILTSCQSFSASPPPLSFSSDLFFSPLLFLAFIHPHSVLETGTPSSWLFLLRPPPQLERGDWGLCKRLASIQTSVTNRAIFHATESLLSIFLPSVCFDRIRNWSEGFIDHSTTLLLNSQFCWCGRFERVYAAQGLAQEPLRINWK